MPAMLTPELRLLVFHWEGFALGATVTALISAVSIAEGPVALSKLPVLLQFSHTQERKTVHLISWLFTWIGGLQLLRYFYYSCYLFRKFGFFF